MAIRHEGQQLDNSQSRQPRPRRPLWVRWLVLSIALLLIVVATILWILDSQGPIVNILPIVIFAVLGVVIALFQWLFPVSHTSAEPTVLIKENSPLNTAASAQIGSTADKHLAPVNMQAASVDLHGTTLTQDQQTIQIKCNHIAAPQGELFDREKTVAEIQECLVDKDVRGILLWGRRGCGKSLIARKIAEDCKSAVGPLAKRFTHIVWLTFRKEELTISGIEERYNYPQSINAIYSEILEVHDKSHLGNKDPLRGVREVLRNAPTLVILDSFEFFIEENFLKEDEKLSRDIADLLKEVAMGSFFLLTSWRDSVEIRDYGGPLCQDRKTGSTKSYLPPFSDTIRTVFAQLLLCENTLQQESGNQAPDVGAPGYKTRNTESMPGGPRVAKYTRECKLLHT
jgi:NB-ARC domain